MVDQFVQKLLREVSINEALALIEEISKSNLCSGRSWLSQVEFNIIFPLLSAGGEGDLVSAGGEGDLDGRRNHLYQYRNW